jgi:hypothetical protein
VRLFDWNIQWGYGAGGRAGIGPISQCVEIALKSASVAQRRCLPKHPALAIQPTGDPDLPLRCIYVWRVANRIR